MEQSKEDRKWLHGKMQSKGYDVGSYEEFEKSLQNKDDADWYYKKASEMGLDVGSREDFEGIFIGQGQKQPSDSSTNEMNEDKMTEDDTQGSYQYKPEVQKHILENKTDMFKPKTVDMYGAHDKDKSVLDLMNEGKLYQMKAMRAASTIGEQLNERIKANDKALKEAYSQREKNNQGHRFVFGAGANVAPKINTNKDDENIKNLLALP